jgi:hypothetical protein
MIDGDDAARAGAQAVAPFVVGIVDDNVEKLGRNQKIRVRGDAVF